MKKTVSFLSVTALIAVSLLSCQSTEETSLIQTGNTVSYESPEDSIKGKRSNSPANSSSHTNASRVNDEAARSSQSTTQPTPVGTGIKDSTGSFTGSVNRPTDLDTAVNSKNSSGSNLPGGY